MGDERCFQITALVSRAITRADRHRYLDAAMIDDEVA
jgi:hypothetical protein